MERVALDIIGPFPLSKKGNKYALIVSDYFTRWAEGYPMPDMETKTIIDNFVNNFVCRFGVPRQIHTDQGRQFESALFKELCTRLCIDKTRTTPYRPQSDGLVERLNRSLEEILSKYVSSNQKDWDEQLPWAFMAYRSSVHESTKFSPCKMMLGREIELPIDLIYGPHPQHEEFIDETQVVNEHMIQITQNMWKVHEKARRNMVNASENQKKQYDIKSYQHSYKKGNVVWLYTPTRVKNISPKLQRKWDGPYFIVTVLSDVTYKIQKNPSSRSQVVHHDRLKPYYGEMMFTCRHCGAEYLSREKMMRHVRNKHSKTIVECNYCSYKVSSSLAFRMREHEKSKHAEQVKAAEKKTKYNNEKAELPENLMALFESPVRPISPLPTTPKKRKTETPKSTENAKSKKEEEKLEERNRHLVLPKKDDLKDEKTRFYGTTLFISNL
ncbi:Hypothetical predicted protein [Mytilus galloprovincialis]|uniref:Integrase catalytic domain-containing protein n=1 Tax=Mytilus galloprovincialis TaxID=29158 RepID=A0A8B6FVZ1_MYTGA|nr:Hypothetical predicted protein [Mytilus galloprovincialis]